MMMEQIFNTLQSIGIIVLTSILLQLLMPHKFRKKIDHIRKNFSKYVSVYDMPVTFTSKSIGIWRDGMLLEESIKEMQANMSKCGMVSHMEHDRIVIDVDLKKHKVRIEIAMYCDEVGSDGQMQLVPSGLEMRFHNKCKFRQLSDCIVEIQEARDRMKDVLGKLGVKMSGDFVISFDVQTLGSMNAMLREAKTGSIKCSIGEDIFEVYDGKIVYYGSVFNRDTTRFLKKIILAYS